MKHRSNSALPDHYGQRSVINLRRNSQLAWPAYLLNLITFLAVVWGEAKRISPLTMFGIVDGQYVLTIPRLLLNIVALLFGLLCSAVVHLLLKGWIIRLLTGQKATYGSKGWYVYAGCDTYLQRGRYILLVMMPDILLVIGLFLLCVFLPVRLFWIGFLILAFHLSRLATNILLSFLILTWPRDAYFRNMGTLTSIYTKDK